MITVHSIHVKTLHIHYNYVQTSILIPSEMALLATDVYIKSLSCSDNET